MEKILKKEAVWETISKAAEIAKKKGGRLSVNIEYEDGQMRIKITVWGDSYSILGHMEFLSGDEPLGAEDAARELQGDIDSRRGE